MSYFNSPLKYVSITKSYGIIPFTVVNEKIYYLMIRRKNTFGYIDIIKGKYNIDNFILMQNLINVMTNQEKNDILECDFLDLWGKMWLYPTTYSDDIKITFTQNIDKIKQYIKRSTTNWKEQEWEFPKGRKNIRETDISCAKREFSEETGINYKKLNIIQNIIPFDEIYIGSNFKCYKFKYFLAYMEDINIDLNNYQRTEVSRIEWLSFEECNKRIREYHYEKKSNLIKINKTIKSLRLI
jgi:ADP-ribose pyrophosphatase YjhB (NUDIX family)